MGLGIVICRSPYISFGACTCNSSQLDHPVLTIICCHGFPGKSLCCLSSGPTDCQPPVASEAAMGLQTLWQWPHAECIQSIKTAPCTYACKNACLAAYAMLTPLQPLFTRGICWFCLPTLLTQAFETEGLPLLTQLLQLSREVLLKC